MQKQSLQDQKYVAAAALLYGAISWGIIWYPYRLLNAAGINGVHASLLSYLLALLLGGALFFRRLPYVGNIPPRAYWLCLIAGWTNLSYVLAIIDGEVMRVMLLFYLSPLWTLILARLWLKERWYAPQLAAIVLSLLGAWLMLADGQWRLPLPNAMSDWLALSAGIGFSMTNVMTRHARYLSVAAKGMLVWVGVFGLSVVFVLFEGVTPLLLAVHDSLQWPQLLWLGLIALMLVSATLLVQYGVTLIPAIQASVLFMFELIVAAVAAYFLAGETMSMAELIGGVLILCAGIVSVINTAKTGQD